VAVVPRHDFLHAGIGEPLTMRPRRRIVGHPSVRRVSPRLLGRSLDVLDTTPILDIERYLSSVPPHEIRRGWPAEAEARRRPGR